jgi:hypothetical protein
MTDSDIQAAAAKWAALGRTELAVIERVRERTPRRKWLTRLSLDVHRHRVEQELTRLEVSD